MEQRHPLHQQGGKRARTSPTINASERLNIITENQLEDGSADNVKNTADANDAAANNSVAADTPSTEDTLRGDIHENEQAVPQEESALGNRLVNRYILPRGSERYDMLIFFSNVRDRLRNYLQSRARELGGIKWNLCVQVEMGRDDAHEVSTTSPYFRSRTYITLSGEGLNEHDLNEALQKMFESLIKFMGEGSGWYVKKVLKLEIQTIVYKPLCGSAYLPLPWTLSKSGSLLNINNRDDKCFLYCLLALLHPVATEPELVEHYYQFSNEVNMSGIMYPVNLSQIKKVENQNESICMYLVMRIKRLFH